MTPIYPWTGEQLLMLRSEYGITPNDELATRIGRSKPAVVQKARELRIGRGREPYRRWSPEMAALLSDLYQTTEAKKIAEIFGVTLAVIKDRVKRLGLKKYGDRRKGVPWTEIQDQKLRDLISENTTLIDLSIALNRSQRAVHQRAIDLSIVEKTYRQLNIGEERVNSSGLLVRKISTARNQGHRNYKRVDVIEWEALNGPLPEGMTLIRMDSKMPRVPSNLALVRIEDHALLSANARMSPEMRMIIGLKSQISKQMNQLERQTASK